MLNEPTLTTLLGEDSAAMPFMQFVLDRLPVTYFITDLKWRMLEVNDYVAKIIGHDKASDVVGMDNYDILGDVGYGACGVEVANHNNQTIVQSEVSQSFSERLPLITGYANFLSCKQPLRNRQNKIIGVVGLGLNVTELFDSPDVRQLIQEIYPSVHFTEREFQCLEYSVQGYTNKSIAEKLKISEFTVSEYLQNVSYKCQCHNKSDLLAYIYPHIFQGIIS